MTDPSSTLKIMIADLENLGWIIAAVVIGLWLLGAIRRSWIRAAYRRQMRRQQRRAQRGEKEAARLLEHEGFEIVDSQVHLLWPVQVGHEEVEIRLIADLIVERDGWRYVAEVKTGDAAPSIKTAATRRQLLEYFVAFECDGVLLVDMERGSIMEVDFSSSGREIGEDSA